MEPVYHPVYTLLCKLSKKSIHDIRIRRIEIKLRITISSHIGILTTREGTVVKDPGFYSSSFSSEERIMAKR